MGEGLSHTEPVQGLRLTNTYIRRKSSDVICQPSCYFSSRKFYLEFVIVSVNMLLLVT